jgi:SEC-C motif
MLIPRTMAKIGRNDPCPCGSGKELKRCCMMEPSVAEPGVNAVETPSSAAETHPDVCDCCGRELDDELNDRAYYIMARLLDGHVDDAETLCLEFIRDFPDDADGHDLLSMIFEDRGQRTQALSLLRKASRIAHDGQDYDAETRLIMRQRIKELELCA